jgi:type II secretory pathway component GspD/PulD (secretin)
MKTVWAVLVLAAWGTSAAAWGEETLQIFPLKHIPATEVAKAASQLFGRDAIMTVEPLTNRLIFRGTPELMAQVHTLVTQLDQAPTSIVVELTIATLQTGETPLDWARSGEELQARLAGLEKEQKLHNVERVKLLTLENQPATMQRGGSRPYVQSTGQAFGGARGQTRSVTYEQVGTVVQVTAATRSSGAVTLEVTVERSEAEPGTPLADEEQSVAAPLRSVLELSTSVHVPDGKTILIAGSDKDGRQLIVLLRASLAKPEE